MARYVDGFVIPVPKKNLKAYQKMAAKAGKLWLKHGAMEYFEFAGDDVPPGKWTSFSKSVKQKPGETVVFSYITFKSRAHRDRVNKKVLQEPWIKEMDPASMPFDMRRLMWGGFRSIVAMVAK